MRLMIVDIWRIVQSPTNIRNNLPPYK